MDKNCQIIPRHYKSSECTIVSVSFSGYCIEETSERSNSKLFAEY